jgi:hypothetical protein
MLHRMDEAQIYTMEGVSAGLIMIFTMSLVLSSTMIFTSGDSHISDMRIQQEVCDILRIMDTPVHLTSSLQPDQSYLEGVVATTDTPATFNATFRQYFSNPKVVAKPTLISGNAVQIDATVWYDNSTVGIPTYGAWYVGSYNLTPRLYLPGLLTQEPGVRVSHWTLFNDATGSSKPANLASSIRPLVNSGSQAMLVEVYLWKA